MDVARFVQMARTQRPVTGKWPESFLNTPSQRTRMAFRPAVIDRFVSEAAVPGILGNIPASGTEIIKVVRRGTRQNQKANRLYVSRFCLSDRSA